MNKLNKEELLGKLDQWIRRARRDEAPDNIIWHIDDDSAYQDIVALIQKPEVTEEWKEEKAKDILKLIGYKIHGEYLNVHIGEAKDFISLIVKEIQEK